MSKPFIFLLIVCAALTAENIYFAYVIADQKQTIEQYMGLQHGKHDGPALPEPEGKPTILSTPQREQNSI